MRWMSNIPMGWTLHHLKGDVAYRLVDRRGQLLGILTTAEPDVVDFFETVTPGDVRGWMIELLQARTKLDELAEELAELRKKVSE